MATSNRSSSSRPARTSRRHTSSARGTKASTTRSRTRRTVATASTRRTSNTRSPSHSARSRRSASGSTRKYGAKAQQMVAKEMRQMKKGKLSTHNPKQAIAIGLSKARRAGAKVPARKKAA